MVKKEANSILKEKNTVQKLTRARRHKLSPRYEALLKNISYIIFSGSVIKYDNFVSSTEGSRHTETIRGLFF